MILVEYFLQDQIKILQIFQIHLSGGERGGFDRGPRRRLAQLSSRISVGLQDWRTWKLHVQLDYGLHRRFCTHRLGLQSQIRVTSDGSAQSDQIWRWQSCLGLRWCRHSNWGSPRIKTDGQEERVIMYF